MKLRAGGSVWTQVSEAPCLPLRDRVGRQVESRAGLGLEPLHLMQVAEPLGPVPAPPKIMSFVGTIDGTFKMIFTVVGDLLFFILPVFTLKL